MDVPNCEHSDSDSGESWTMLDHSPSHADEAPEFPGTPGNHEGETETADHTDRDDDTDGISIISDSEPESPTPCELPTCHQVAAECGDCQTEQHTSQYVMDITQSVNKLENLDDNVRSQHDFLGDSTGKMRTYVHRRNKRLSTVLNIIMLGSLITAAGVAIGHMWGARDDCAAPPAPSVNKILSNLYKLQEENAYLRSKLKELTLANIQLIQQQKFDTQKFEQNKKGFDDNLAKCAAFEYYSSDKVLENHLMEPEFEKDFITDIDKLKTIYKQNRSWLDEEVAKRQRYEELNLRKLKSSLKAAKEENKRMNPETDATDKMVKIEDEPHIYTTTEGPNDNISKLKITYADSLKTDSKNGERKKRNIKDVGGYDLEKESGKKKKLKRQLDVISERSLSDDEIIKDNRYAAMKHKEEKKKNRQKTNKKQKRRNKYEQWEMKGGYLKDYDDISVASSQDAAAAGAVPTPEKEANDFVLINNDANENQNESTGRYKSYEKPKKDEKDNSNWYDKRMSQRSEARKRLEQEMFGAGERGGAGWYFRRARRRDTPAHLHPGHSSKRNRNYKTKQ